MRSRSRVCLRAMRAAVVVALTMFVSQVVNAQPAHASGSCGAGTPFVYTTIGSIEYGDPDDWWQTSSHNPTITLQPDANDVDLYVYNQNCLLLCSSAIGGAAKDECTVTHSGTLNILAHLYSGNSSGYTLTVNPSVPGPSGPQCRDGIDNDLDSRTDYPDDPDCDYPDDPTEGNPSSPIPAGPRCHLSAWSDVSRESGWQLGEVHAGPLVTGAPGTLRCRILVNDYGHSSSAVWETTSRDTDGVVVLEPRFAAYQATASDMVYLCTSWIPDNGTALYWNSEYGSTTGDGQWDVYRNLCEYVPHAKPTDPECPIWLALDQHLGTKMAEIWQDCEPYSPII